MIYVVATVSITPGRRDDFLREFRRLVPLVHTETGCLEYGPAIDLDAGGIASQPAIRAEVVTIVEKWESLLALKDHLAAPHMLRYRETVKELVAGVEIRVLQPV